MRFATLRLHLCWSGISLSFIYDVWALFCYSPILICNLRSNPTAFHRAPLFFTSLNRISFRPLLFVHFLALRRPRWRPFVAAYFLRYNLVRRIRIITTCRKQYAIRIIATYSTTPLVVFSTFKTKRCFNLLGLYAGVLSWAQLAWLPNFRTFRLL